MAAPFWTPEELESMVSDRARILGPAVWAAATPDPRPVISFAGGLPDIPSLPGELLLRAARTVIDREQKEALEYGGTFGPLPLRKAIAARSTELEASRSESRTSLSVPARRTALDWSAKPSSTPATPYSLKAPTSPGVCGPSAPSGSSRSRCR